MPDEDQPAAPDRSGPSRRALLKGAAIGAGTAWVVPTVLTIDASPAAASAAGCADCSQNIIPIADGNGTSLSSWSNVVNLTATGGPSGVFQATSATAGTANRTRDFSTACTTRFGTQTPVNITLAANLDAGGNGPTSVTATFFAGAAGTGALLATLTISTTTSSSLAIAIPGTTRSVRIAMSAGGGNGAGGGNKGTIDNVTLTLGAC